MTPKRPYRPWTHKEIAFLRSAYAAGVGRVAIGRAIDRHPHAVGEKARRLGIARKHFAMGEDAKQELIRLTGLGWSEKDTAEALGTNYRTVRTYRAALGIVGQPRSERYRRKVAERTKIQCREEGVSSLVEIRWLTHRVEAFKGERERGRPAR